MVLSVHYPRCLSRWVAAQRPEDVCGGMLGQLGRYLSMIQERHSTLADQIVYHLEGVPESPCFSSASK